jgi:hypothetical protein
MVKVMIARVLGREETFAVSVRRGTNALRFAKDSQLLLLPPLEVAKFIWYQVPINYY